MIKFCTILLALILPISTYAVERLECEIQSDKVGFDITNEYDIKTLCNANYTAFHSNLDRIPYLVVEKITKQDLGKKEARTNDFRPDDRLRKSQRSELKDYYKSGYDRGHLAPSANYVSKEDISSTFLLSNIIPQNSDLNRTLWKNIENYARIKANLNGTAFILTGVTFNHCLIEERLNSRVAVPDKVFKLIESGGKVEVFMADNIKPKSTKIAPYKITLEDLNKSLCGIKIYVKS